MSAPVHPDERGDRPRDEPKRYWLGTHRARPPAETLENILPVASRIGVTRLANVTGLDWVGVPVYNAIRPNSRSLSVSQGKGVDPVAAKVSALMESIEYWHAENIVLPLRHESCRQLRRETEVVDIHRLALRGALDSMGSGMRQISARATPRPELPTYWLEGRDLLAQRPIWLPYESVRLNKVGLDYAETTFRVDSNGLAAGNTIAEAAVHALCELVERDALTLWWQRVATPDDAAETRVDLSTVDDPVIGGVLDAFAVAGMDVAVWDVTSDISVPTYQCCLVERASRAGWRPFGASWGYGAHPAPEVALSRALTEAAQSRVTAIAGSRDDNFPGQYTAQNDPTKLGAIRAFLFGRPGEVDFRQRAGLATSFSEFDLAALLAAIKNAGLDTAVLVDLTHPEIGIPTVKVIAPGLEYFSLFPGYSPGPRAREAARRGEPR